MDLETLSAGLKLFGTSGLLLGCILEMRHFWEKRDEKREADLQAAERRFQQDLDRARRYAEEDAKRDARKWDDERLQLNQRAEKAEHTQEKMGEDLARSKQRENALSAELAAKEYEARETLRQRDEAIKGKDIANAEKYAALRKIEADRKKPFRLYNLPPVFDPGAVGHTPPLTAWHLPNLPS